MRSEGNEILSVPARMCYNITNMANQQLKDYFIQQSKLGISKDAIKSALLEAGWSESDVNGAMAESSPAAQVAPQTTPAQTSTPAVISQSFQKQPETAAKPSSPFITSDIFKPRGEPVFQPMTSVNASNVIGEKQEIASVSLKKKLMEEGNKILIIFLGIASIVLLMGNVYFFLQNGNLNGRIDSLRKASSLLGDKETQIVSLSSEKTALSDQVDSLNKTIADLNGQLSIFAPSPAGSTIPIPFDVNGTLGGGGKSLYSITTSKGIILFVKNSRDATVDAFLKPLLETNVRLEGTHQSGSVQLTATAVNGQEIQPVNPETKTTGGVP